MTGPGPIDRGWTPGRRRPRAGSLRSSPWTIGLLGLVLGLLAGWLRRPPTPAAGPTMPVSEGIRPTRSEVDPDRARAQLESLRREVEAATAIRAALDLVDGLPTETTWATWNEGRLAYRGFAPRIRERLAALGRLAPDAKTVGEASRLFVIQELLTRTRRTDVEPLFEPGEGPDPGSLVRGVARLDPFPALDRWLQGSTPEDWHAADLAALAREGGRWETLRTWQATRRQTPQGELYDDSLKPRNPRGDGFMDPGHGVSGAIAVTFAGALGQKRSYADSPLSILVEIRDQPGDLELAFTIRDWDTSYLLVAEIESREGSLFLAWERPGSDLEAEKDKDEPRIGARLVVDASVLPPGANKKLRFSCWGLQPIGAPKEAVRLGEVHQRLG